MNVLYIGVYLDGTGWANMAKNSILALDSVGINVVARPLKLNNTKVETHPRIAELQGRRFTTYDAVIQNVLPNHMEYSGRIPKNIGYYCSETSQFKRSDWADKINCMDSAWVCNQQSLVASTDSGVKVPLDIVPIACDISKYQRKYKPLSIRERLGNSFIFYYIGDFNKRKNISALIKAFHIEFDVSEPVNLVIKTDIGNSLDEYDRMKSREKITKELNDIKEALKIYNSPNHYKEEIILTGRYTDEEIMRLHASCDCFVCPSFGEAWCIPAFDAMALGKTPIVTGNTGFLQYMSDKEGWLVKNNAEPVFAMHRSLPKIFTAYEDWYASDIRHLQECMRLAYADGLKRKEKAEAGIARAHDFTYEKVGQIMKRILEWTD